MMKNLNFLVTGEREIWEIKRRYLEDTSCFIICAISQQNTTVNLWNILTSLLKAACKLTFHFFFFESCYYRMTKRLIRGSLPQNLVSVKTKLSQVLFLLSCIHLHKLNKWTLQCGVPLISGMKALAKCLLFSRQAFKEIFFRCLLWQSPVISANLLLAKWVQDLTNCTLYNRLSFSLLSKLSKSLNYLSLLIYKYKLFKFWNKNFY